MSWIKPLKIIKQSRGAGTAQILLMVCLADLIVPSVSASPLVFLTHPFLVPSNLAEERETSHDQKDQKEGDPFREALNEYRRQIDQTLTKTRSGAAQSDVKSRSSQFHGNFYEYLRNDSLDALPHEVKQAGGEKSILRRNQFGFNITGPVVIPWFIRGDSKTFFSATYEGTREKMSHSSLLTVPTIRQRTGDFSDLVDSAGIPVTIYDPRTTRPNPAFDPALPVTTDNLQYLRDPFPGNLIPRERIDAVSQKLIDYCPLPNASVGPFLRNNYFINGVESNTPNGLIWKLDHSIGTRHKLSLGGSYSNGLNGSSPLIENVANPGYPGHRVQARSLSMSETFNISPALVNQFGLATSYNSQRSEFSGEGVNFPEILGLRGVQPAVFPRFEVWDNYIDFGLPSGAMSNYQAAYYSLSNYLTYRFKKHNLRFSLSSLWSQVNSFQSGSPSGRFDFHGPLTSLPGINNTGNAFAQFLMGWADRAEQSLVLNPTYFRNKKFRLGWGDDYQLTPNFRLSFSLGMQIDTPRREKYNRQSTVDLRLINPANERPGALAFAGMGGQASTFSPAQINWEPSLSWALNPWGDRRTVIRGSYSLWYDSYPLYATSFGTLGYNARPLMISPNGQLTPVMVLAAGYPSNFVPPPNLRPDAANGIRADYFDPKGTLPYGQDWGLEIERDFLWNMIFHVSYHGGKGTHLYNGSGLELNPLPVSALAYRDRLNDLDFNLSLRPYPQYPSINPGYPYPIGSSSYHGGNMRLEKRMSHGLNFNFSYSFGKSIDDVMYGYPPQNSNMLQREKSLSQSDITHQTSFSALYELPFGSGKPIFNQSSWIDKMLGRWTLSGTAYFRSGFPLMLVPLFNNTGGVAEALRVNEVPGVDPTVKNPSPELWFNPAAFDQPADFTLGNVSRRHPSLRGPGAQNMDMSLTKRVPIMQEWSLEVLLEAFNAFNHGNWNQPDTTIGSQEHPNLNAGKIIGSYGGRIVQLGFRINF